MERKKKIFLAALLSLLLLLLFFLFNQRFRSKQKDTGSSSLPESSSSQNEKEKEILGVGIEYSTDGVYTPAGLKIEWRVENAGEVPLSFDKNMIAQVLIGVPGEKYPIETEAITLQPKEEYRRTFVFPYTVIYKNRANTIKINATTTRGTSGSVRQCFNWED